QAEGTGPARQLRPSRDAVSRPDTGHARADLNHPRAVLMAEELDRGLGLETARDALVRESPDAEGELGLGDAGLDAERLGDHVARPADWLRHVIQPHVAEVVESPGFHARLLAKAGELLERVAIGRDRAAIAPARPGHLAHIKVPP